MKRSSSISQNFFKRSGLKRLVPDLKLLLAVLTVGSESHVGCWIPSGLGDESGLDPSALDGGMDDLERRGFILRDTATDELFLLNFFRDNTYKGPARLKQARGGYLFVRSEKLRTAIIKAVSASPECGLSALSLENQEGTYQGEGEGKGEGFSTAPRRGEKAAASSELNGLEENRRDLDETENFGLEAGLIIKNDRDRVCMLRLLERYGHEKVIAQAATLPVPYPTKVAKLLLAAEEKEAVLCA